MNFRCDINGLRAIAVIAVLLFHFNPSLLPGGYAGVDVFFVISGFLMTGIILRGIGDGGFSLVGFYVARAKRIIPALSVVCFFVLIIGYFSFIQLETFERLARHVFSSAFFVSNVIYYFESGYFDVESRNKLLLHTWSLSVEWQFYIVYPILLMLLKRYLSIDLVKRVVLCGAVIGFLFSVFATSKWPTFAYYLLPARAWEMLVGGVAFIYPWHLSERFNKFVEIVGFLLIISSFFFFSSGTPWPGYFAAMPVLGCYLMIVANQQSSVITNNVIFQCVGRWSYSIYLWHWPLVSFAYLYSVNIDYVLTIAMTLGSVFMGWLSFVLIESKKNKHGIAIFISIVLISLIVIGLKIGPFRYLYVESVANSMKRKAYDCFDRAGQSSQDVVVCKLSDGNKKVVALGDSHMYSSLPVLEDIANSNNIELSYVGFSGCPPLLDIYPIRGDQNIRDCHELNKKVVSYITSNNVDVVYLAARWTYYTEGSYSGEDLQYLSTVSSNESVDKDKSIEALEIGLTDALKAYSDAGVKVVLLLQVPMQLRDPDKIYFDAMGFFGVNSEKLEYLSVEKNKHNNFQLRTNNLIKKVSSKFGNVVLIDPSVSFCLSEHCAIGNDNYSFYFDDDHLSIQGSYKLHNQLLPSITD